MSQPPDEDQSDEDRARDLVGGLCGCAILSLLVALIVLTWRLILGVFL